MNLRLIVRQRNLKQETKKLPKKEIKCKNNLMELSFCVLRIFEFLRIFFYVFECFFAFCKFAHGFVGDERASGSVHVLEGGRGNVGKHFIGMLKKKEREKEERSISKSRGEGKRREEKEGEGSEGKGKRRRERRKRMRKKRKGREESSRREGRNSM